MATQSDKGLTKPHNLYPSKGAGKTLTLPSLDLSYRKRYN